MKVICIFQPQGPTLQERMLQLLRTQEKGGAQGWKPQK